VKPFYLSNRSTFQTQLVPLPAGAARHLQSAALAVSNSTDGGGADGDPMAVVRAAAAMTSVMQGPGMQGAIDGRVVRSTTFQHIISQAKHIQLMTASVVRPCNQFDTRE
jgi:hypothetical protein